MSEIIKEATVDELITANQRNLLGFFYLTSQNAKEINYYDDEGIEGIYSPNMPVNVINRIIRTDTIEENFDDVKERVSQFYGKKGAPLFWEVWPTNSTSDVEMELKNSGFSYSHEYPAMIIKLDQVKIKELTNFEIKIVKNEYDARTLANLFQEIYQLPDAGGEDFYNTIVNSGYDSDLVSYIGYEESEPVCIATIYYHAGVAGIYNVGTKEKYCRKGYGRKITEVALLDAKKRGFEFGILQSSDQGYKVYQRMGFENQCMVQSYKK
ncbi:N-acetyltransferase [Filobacillus milosensis]|uniref:N-acetyltransferase n=1 Tax=Filobacillus milosensis TaxID=94137 RepID=A0A4Y8ISQ6_9BACI|nr:GNAT family N-acetyltransferase [Filobacillus milosensis]TFB23817.1 N-acetyltransferase [Filobacillus milosensis]